MSFVHRYLAVPVVALFTLAQIGLGQERTPQAGSMPNPEFPATPDFTRYALPSECAAAVRWQETVVWRDKRADTLYMPPTGRSLAPTTIAAVRRCLSQVRLSDTTPDRLVALGRAYLAIEANTQANAAFRRAAVMGSTSATRATIYRQIVDEYVHAPHPNLDGALRYVQSLDSLGALAAIDRIVAHKAIAEEARRQDSVPLAASQLDAALQASRTVSVEERREFAPQLFSLYQGRADIAVRHSEGDSARRILLAGRDSLVRWRAAVEDRFNDAAPFYALIGDTAPPIRATRWFPDQRGDTTRPMLGKAQVVVFVSSACENACFSGYAVLRRLARVYATRDLQITLVARTLGAFDGALVPPDSEMVLTKTYLLDHLQLPGALAIWRTDFGTRDDGHLVVRSAPNEVAYPSSLDLTAYIVDRHGVVRLTTTLAPRNEAMIRDVVKESL